MQINDCLFAPTSVTNFKEKGATFAYIHDTESEDCQFNNCYYTQTFGEATQGKLRHSITVGENVTVENVGIGTVTEYDVSGITGYFPGIVYDGVLYAGSGDEVRLNLDYERTGYSATGYSASSGTLTGSATPYTLAMPDADVTISATAARNTLELDNASDNSTTISDAAASGKVYDVTLADRTLFHDNSWNTLCLPFDVTAEQIAVSTNPLHDAIVMELDIDGYYDGSNTRYTYDGETYHDANGDAYTGDASAMKFTGFDATSGTLYLYFKDATAIEAGKPYLVKWTTTDASAGQNPTFTDVTVTSITTGKGVMSLDGKVSLRGNTMKRNYQTPAMCVKEYSIAASVLVT